MVTFRHRQHNPADKMRVLSLLLFVLWASCLHAQLSHEWQLFQDFVQRYSKPYANDSKVFETRFSAFKVVRDDCPSIVIYTPLLHTCRRVSNAISG